MKGLMLKTVEFNQVSMLACKAKEGQIYVSIRSICEGLGVDNSSQMKRIQREDILNSCVVKMTIELSGQNREVSFMDIDYLPYFLVGIKSSLCREEIRPMLKDFKLKAKDVLADAFIKKNQSYYLQREAGKIIRNMLTDAIRDKVPESPHKQFMYPNYTKLIYRILFNKTVKELRIDYKVPRSKSLRDFFNADELKEIQELENIITGLISLGMGYAEIKDILGRRYLKQIA